MTHERKDKEIVKQQTTQIGRPWPRQSETKECVGVTERERERDGGGEGKWVARSSDKNDVNGELGRKVGRGK